MYSLLSRTVTSKFFLPKPFSGFSDFFNGFFFAHMRKWASSCGDELTQFFQMRPGFSGLSFFIFSHLYDKNNIFYTALSRLVNLR